MIQEQTGHPEDSTPHFLTTSDHSYPRAGVLPVVGNDATAADAGALTPDPLHDHCLAGFQRVAHDALKDESITDEQRAAIIEGARSRYGWTVEEARVWMARHKA